MIIGHKNQWRFLVKSAELNRLPHAFLFYGQNQIGKKTLAIEFAKFLNCQSKNISKKPCQVCRSCQDIQKGGFADSVLVEPNGTSKEIQISQIRGLINKLSLRPYSADFKIAILDNAHSMTREAQSCFLKCLEEPKGKALLILITAHPRLILPTILSRVQKLRFSPVKNSEIENYLTEKKDSKEGIKDILFLSSGKPGQVINFLSSRQKFANQRKIISDLIKISNSDLAYRFQYAKNLSEKSSGRETSDLQEILDIWLNYLRNTFLSRLSSRPREEILKHYSLTKLKKIIGLIQTTDFLISTTNLNTKLALENLLIQL